MNINEAIAKLTKVAKKPKFYFIYEIGDDYSHELNVEPNDENNPHTGGVHDVTCVRTTTWRKRSKCEITVKVEDNIILTHNGYLKFNTKNTDLETLFFPYNFSDTEFIMNVWDERFQNIITQGI